VIVVDTGPLVAAAIANDDHHHTCVELFTGAHLAGRRLVVSPLVVAEVCYLLEREAGSHVEAEFLRSLRDQDFALEQLTRNDLDRMAELVDTYADLPLGATDASVIALAERVRTSDVATLDRRDFSVVRPRNVGPLTLLP
jgi:predicted nucleic acid-binding protein